MRGQRGTKRWVGLTAGAVLVAGTWLAAPRVQGAPPAQTGTPLAYGDTVTGEITEAGPCLYYWFEGQAGDAITLDMQRTSGSLDGQLWLYLRDGDGTTADPVAFNDDRPGGGLNPLIETTLPATGWYMVGACRLQHANMRVTVGTFTLALTGPGSTGGGAGATPEIASESEGVMGAAATPTAGSGLTGDLFPASTATTPTAASQDGSLTGDLFPAGTPDATEDAGQDGSEPFPFGYAPPPEATAQALPPDEVIALVYDQPVAGYLWAEQSERLHQLPVRAGDAIVIEWQQATGALRPRITVTTPDGSVIARVELPDAVRGVRLEFAAPDVPAVVIHVARFEGDLDGSAGGYTLLARQG